jgi:hypothetical protein
LRIQKNRENLNVSSETKKMSEQPVTTEVNEQVEENESHSDKKDDDKLLEDNHDHRDAGTPVISSKKRVFPTLPSSCCSSTSSMSYLEYSFCACCLLGNIESEFAREKSFSCWNNCCSPSFTSHYCFGPAGLKKCVLGGCANAIGWPLSPCLSCYLLRERWKLLLFYPYEDSLSHRLPATRTVKDCCYYSCCWQTNLKEQHSLVHNLSKEGHLTFLWDYEKYRDHLLRKDLLSSVFPSFLYSSASATSVSPSSAYNSHTVLIFGPTTPLKQQFLRKLLMQTNSKELSQLNRDFPLLNDIHHIQTGVKSIVNEHNNYNLEFLEYWDIPLPHFYSSFIGQLKETSSLSLFLFDINDYHNFGELKKIFHFYDFLVNKPRIIILLKDNPQNVNNGEGNHTIYNNDGSETSSEDEDGDTGKVKPQKKGSTGSGFISALDKISIEAEILTWAKRQGVAWFHLSVFDEFSYQSLNKQIIKLLAPSASSSSPSRVIH